MEDSRQSTVLFADVSGSTQLYQVAGDTTAHGAISGCLELMRKAVEAARGRVVKTMGDEVMALFPIQLKGKAEGVALCEVLWFASGERTAFDGFRPRVRTSGLLRLKYLGQETVRRRESESVTLGRESGCGLTVADHLASRRHCTIERRQDKWGLKDHSSNGTFVTVEGDAEIMLQREEMMLRRSGWIPPGHPPAEGGGAVEYACA